ncbi:MAG: nucleotidyltransferase [Bacteroidetes bacterium]|nr:MAG: nucleotidyltransferase [Bacteroidota bacterium]
MNIQQLYQSKQILLECVSGSRAYGLATPSSDTDIRGVFALTKNRFYGLEYDPQINDETNDVVFYEVKRFVELLTVNNPNILELLATPKEFILQRNPILDTLKPELFLSKLCQKTFGNYALSQIQKAQGLKKKIFNPVDKVRKTVLEFCFVNYNNGSIPVLKFLNIKGGRQENCGLVNIPNMPSMFGLYYNPSIPYRGVMNKEMANDIALSSIPKGEEQIGMLYFNKDGYSKYCKQYKEYWDWVEKRNDARYQGTLDHGKSYDAKNMMHTFRLLEMATEIAKEGRVNVKRPNRDFLLGIKRGDYEFDYLIDKANDKKAEMEEAFSISSLQSNPNKEKIQKLLIEIRSELYS